MNRKLLLEYLETQEEVLQIARHIADERIHVDVTEEAVLFVTEVDFSPIDQNIVSIFAYIDHGPGQVEKKVLHVDIDDFCDPKYLLDIIEESC